MWIQLVFRCLSSLNDGETVFCRACTSSALKASCRSALARPTAPVAHGHWVKTKNPKHPAVKREAEEDWSK